MDNVLIYGEYQLNRSLVRSERLSVQIRAILGATLVEKMGCSWRILSAKYYLVHPGEEIRPYEKTLNTIRVKERRAWADRVLAELEPCLVGVDTVVFLAGKPYREFLEPSLRQRGLQVRVPMRGLRLGQQLAWLDACVHG